MDFINTRINNTFAFANKGDLNKIKSYWNKINDYLLDEKHGINCGILKDTEVVAAGGIYLILTSNFESIVDKANERLEELENSLYNIFSTKYHMIVLTNDLWQKEKEKYIANIKNGYKYSEKEETKEIRNNNEKTPVDELIDIIGEDLIVME